jgi:hypothetical protein
VKQKLSSAPTFLSPCFSVFGLPSLRGQVDVWVQAKWENHGHIGPSNMSDGSARMYCMYFNVILTNHCCFYLRPVPLYTSLIKYSYFPYHFSATVISPPSPPSRTTIPRIQTFTAKKKSPARNSPGTKDDSPRNSRL